VVAAGSTENLGRLRGQLWKGPGLSRVEAVEEFDAGPVARGDFRIEY